MRKIFYFVLIAIAFLSLFRKLPENDILRGQIEKQVFKVHLADSFANGSFQGVFPKRNFVEIYHKGPILWAEEFPLYELLVAAINKITGLSAPVAARSLSLLFFFLLLLGAFKLGEFFNVTKDIRWFFPAVILFFPVFRQYAVSTMPDMPMLTCALWGIYFFFKKKLYYAIPVFVVAVLFKYYAAFTVLAVLIFLVIKTLFYKEMSLRQFLVQSVLLSFTPIPALLYLFYVFHAGIPNAVQDSMIYQSSAHMLAAGNVFIFSLYRKILTWLFVKNIGFAGLLSFALGVFFIWKKSYFKKDKNLFLFLFSLAISTFIFAFLFAPSFAVHDYYGIQFSLLTAFVSALGVLELKFLFGKNCDLHFKTFKCEMWFFYFLIALFAVINLKTTYSATIRQESYKKAASEISGLVKKTDKLLILSDLTPHVLAYHIGNEAWVLKEHDYERFKSYFEAKLKANDFDFIVLFFTQTGESKLKVHFNVLRSKGFIEILRKNFLSSHKKDPGSIISILRKSNVDN